MTTLDKTNFFTSSKSIFVECNKMEVPADYISLDKKTGKVSSKYWYTNEGVVRESDHWGEVASCIWVLNGISKRFDFCQVLNETKTGFCSFEDMTNVTQKFQQIVDNGIREYKNTLGDNWLEKYNHRESANYYFDNLIKLFNL